MKTMIVAAAGLVLAGNMLACEGAAAKTKAIYQFCRLAGCADGKNPEGALVQDSSGNLYGTTALGGAYNGGTIFELIPAATGRWKLRLLYSFCQDGTVCADGEGGSYPGSALILDTAGNLYGTTCGGGSEERGVAFELVRAKRSWHYKVVANFPNASCPTGLTYAGAATGAPYDGSSPLYGTAEYGGDLSEGSVFRLLHTGNTWDPVEQLYSFCSQSLCTDGRDPNANVVADAYGNLFGTTLGGGAYTSYPGGTVFEIAHDTWAETVLHSFEDGAGCCSLPTSPVTLTANGVIGATFSPGVVFSMQQNGTGFGSLNTTAPIPGTIYHAGVLVDGNGNIFGVSNSGGSLSGGALFRISPHGKLKVLDNFAHGSSPEAGVIANARGDLFGTVEGGGSFGGGWVYEYIPK